MSDQQRGHVANCRCDSDKTSKRYDHTDPRCLPGLLWDAKVRLAAIEQAVSRMDETEMPTQYYHPVIRLVQETRAEVERLEKESS